MQASLSQARSANAGTTAGTAPRTALGFARLSQASAFTFVVLLVLLHALKPELDPSYRFVSEYAVGQHGWVMIVAFLVLSLGCASLFAAIRGQVTTRAGKAGLALLAIATVALAVGGIFPMDPITIAPEDATLHGKIHGFAAMIGIPALPVAALLISANLRRLPAWSAARGALRWSAHLPWMSLVLMDVVLFVSLSRGGKFGPEVPIGWPNRLVVLAFALWLMVVGRYATRVRSGEA